MAAVCALTFAELTGFKLVAAHVLAFYALTAGAYAALPFVRRGDILMAAVWLVLVAGVAPCALGREISAPLMFSDMAGALMAAAPIYVARLRQLAQGDVRDQPRRRQGDDAAAAAQTSSR
jgi:hypothetical protein